jgi:hypothetical protein
MDSEQCDRVPTAGQPTSTPGKPRSKNMTLASVASFLAPRASAALSVTRTVPAERSSIGVIVTSTTRRSAVQPAGAMVDADMELDIQGRQIGKGPGW